MKNKVIRFKNNLQYYVLNEIFYDNRRFILCIEVDNDIGLIKNNYAIFEANIKNDRTFVSSIKDPFITKIILNYFKSEIK